MSCTITTTKRSPFIQHISNSIACSHIKGQGVTENRGSKGGYQYDQYQELDLVSVHCPAADR